MPRKITIEVTDETIAQVERYCRITGKDSEKIINIDFSDCVNDLICQYADLRDECMRPCYQSFEAASQAAERYWRNTGPEWEGPLRLTFMHNGVRTTQYFCSPVPPPENWLRCPGGGYMRVDPDTPQEEINRLINEGVL
jgi:hypothetical protein